jgi:hypothetical protein
MTPALRLTSFASAALGLLLAACGGGGGGALGNPQTVENPAGNSGQKLSFVYFQRCINPVLLARLQINVNGVVSTNTCAGGGCHDNVTGTGGALRLTAAAPALDLADPANTPDVVRASEMYKNFYSSQGETVVGTPAQSRLLNKPLLRSVLHGGGLIFDNPGDPNAKLFNYWITRPVPKGQDEFASADGMFTPPNAATGACNTE